MAWTYSDYVTMSGSARLAELQLHIQEVSNKITEEYSVGSRSKSLASLEKYLENLQAQEAKLGGQAPRSDGRSRVLRADFKEPQGVD